MTKPVKVTVSIEGSTLNISFIPTDEEVQNRFLVYEVRNFFKELVTSLLGNDFDFKSDVHGIDVMGTDVKGQILYNGNPRWEVEVKLTR